MRLRRLAKLLLRDRLCQGQHLLANFAARQHQHHQHLPPMGGDQLQVLEDALARGAGAVTSEAACDWCASTEAARRIQWSTSCPPGRTGG